MDRNEKLEKIHVKKLPFLYKLILKIPVPDLDTSSGIFWAIIVSIFIVLNLFLSLFLLLYFPFPVNMLLISTVPAIVFIVFAKITLKRFINWWNTEVIREAARRDLEEVLDEYIILVEKTKEE